MHMLHSLKISALVFCAFTALPVMSSNKIHPFQVPQPASAPDEVLAGIEISAGSFSKYEIDKDSGHLVLDRFQSMPVVYPANYGFLPSTLAGDGDTLDVLVLSREPVVPTAFIRVRPIGILKMVDGGEQDDKIIAVPADDVDPQYRSIRDISDLPDIEKERIEAFFRVYKDLPIGRKIVELGGFENAEAARAMIQQALESAP